MPIPHILPTSGPLSFQEIEDEFGGSHPIDLTEYYGQDPGIPASGTISVSDFYDKGAEHSWCNYQPLLSDYYKTLYADRSSGVYTMGRDIGWIPYQIHWNGSEYIGGNKGHFFKVVGNQVLRYAYEFPEGYNYVAVIPISGNSFLVTATTQALGVGGWLVRFITFDWDADPKVVLGDIIPLVIPSKGSKHFAQPSVIVENKDGYENADDFVILLIINYISTSSNEDGIVSYQAHRVGVNSGIIASGPFYDYPENTAVPMFRSHKAFVNSDNGYFFDAKSPNGDMMSPDPSARAFVVIDSNLNITKNQVASTEVDWLLFVASSAGTLEGQNAVVTGLINGLIEVNLPDAGLTNVDKIPVPNGYIATSLHLNDGCLTALLVNEEGTFMWVRSNGDLSGFTDFDIVSQFNVYRQSSGYGLIAPSVRPHSKSEFLLFVTMTDDDAPQSMQELFTI